MPKDYGLDFEDIFLKTADNLSLNAWFIPAQDSHFTLLFCHGNAGNLSHRLEKIKFFNQLHCDVFIFDYRGYGRSDGRPSEKGMYLDTQAAYDYLLSRGIKEEQIIGYGESLGSAAIIDLAAKNKMAGLILEGAFSSAKDMAAHVYPYLPHWLFSIRFDSARKIKNINIPKLFIHSINDEIVPFRLGERLYEVSASPKEFLKIQGPHNSCFYDSEELLKVKISDFLNRHK